MADDFGVVEPAGLHREDFLDRCRSGSYRDVEVILRTFDSVRRLGSV